ncbi:MAG: hypothetical protein AAGG68_18170 [Bacteroidota bacterium]
MKRIHFLSSILLTAFIGIHLFNHFLSIFGIETHLRFMEMARMVYRNILVESLLLLSVLVQIISGSKLLSAKRKIAITTFQKLQLWTGLYLAFFLLIHVSAVLVSRFVLELDTNFYFGAAGINIFPFNLFFVPYYSLAIFSFFGHLAAIHQQKTKQSILGLSSTQQAKLILSVGILSILLIFHGLTNGFTGVDIPKAYQVLVGK